MGDTPYLGEGELPAFGEALADLDWPFSSGLVLLGIWKVVSSLLLPSSLLTSSMRSLSRNCLSRSLTFSFEAGLFGYFIIWDMLGDDLLLALLE